MKRTVKINTKKMRFAIVRGNVKERDGHGEELNLHTLRAVFGADELHNEVSEAIKEFEDQIEEWRDGGDEPDTFTVCTLTYYDDERPTLHPMFSLMSYTMDQVSGNVESKDSLDAFTLALV